VTSWHAKGEASAVTLYDVGDVELVKKYSSVELDADGRIVAFTEKPESPTSTLVATASYIYHRAHVPLVQRYLDDGNVPDQPGRFIAWLCTRAPVYGFVIHGDWRDIGDAAQLLEADNALRARMGMSRQDSYSLD
jgi:glucose-1-phosphate thymidylyltransferase